MDHLDNDKEVRLVEEYRGDVLECVHSGHICGVSAADGTIKVKYSAGDPFFTAFLRSAGKPIQAIPGIKQGIAEKYHFTDKEIAIMAGSHSGESFHVEALESMSQKTGVLEEELVCSSTYPPHGPTRKAIIAAGMPARSFYHNCSGKHMGVLSFCKAKGYSTHDYAERDHPAQVEILETLSMLADIPKEQISIGKDGCGFPVFALPLSNIATAYLRLTCPELIEDTAVREAVQFITDRMSKNGEMVAGTGELGSTLLQDDNIIAKSGAKGIFCFGLREEKLGFAFKVLDGSPDEHALIIISILEQIGYRRQETINRLRELYPARIVNDNGHIVGHNKAVFQLASKD